MYTSLDATQTAYRSMIDENVRNQLKTYFKLSNLTFIPVRSWSGDPKDIEEEVKLRPRPLPLQIELMIRDDKFLFQLDDRNLEGKFTADSLARQTAWDRTVSVWSKLDKTNTNSNEIINEDIKDLIYSNLIQHQEDAIDLVESVLDFSMEIIPDVRSYYFLALLNQYLKQTLLGQPNIYWRLRQLGLDTDYFLFKDTYHLKSLMKFANPSPVKEEMLVESAMRINAKPGLIIADIDEGEPGEALVIPVMRYQRSTGSLYYDPSEESYCGTFYYFEPYSSIYLFCNWVLVTDNKILAARELGMSIEEVAEILEEEVKEIEDFWEGRRLIPLDDEFYSYEDELDQDICKFAHEEGYEVIILKMMNGTNRYVTEILDVRSRSKSFQSLYLMVE